MLLFHNITLEKSIKTTEQQQQKTFAYKYIAHLILCTKIFILQKQKSISVLATK